MKKKNGHIQCCLNFRDLNKAFPKDDFSLSSIDMLFDDTASHDMLSIIDGFISCNHLSLSDDAKKTFLRTPMGDFFYTVIPFRPKNAGLLTIWPKSAGAT